MSIFDDHPYPGGQGVQGGQVPGMGANAGTPSMPGYSLDPRTGAQVYTGGAPMQVFNPQNPMGGAGATGSTDPMDDTYILSQIKMLAQQPGADPTLASDPTYWLGKIKETGGWTDKTAKGENNIGFWTARSKAGAGGPAGGAAGGPLSSMGMDPSYGWRFGEGMKAIQGSAAARGSLFTPGTIKSLVNYGQGAASQEYGNIFGRNLSLANLGLQATGLGLGANTAQGQQLGTYQYGAQNNANNRSGTLEGIGDVNAQAIAAKQAANNAALANTWGAAQTAINAQWPAKPKV